MATDGGEEKTGVRSQNGGSDGNGLTAKYANHANHGWGKVEQEETEQTEGRVNHETHEPTQKRKSRSLISPPGVIRW